MMKTHPLFALAGIALALTMGTAAAADYKVQKHHEAVIKDCTMCHTKENAIAGNVFVVPSDKTCIACHGGYDTLAAKTNKLAEPNPHKSHHYGQNISCTACHKEHSKPTVYCNECHEFKYKMP